MVALEVERNYIRDSFREPVTAGPYRTKPRSGRGSMNSEYFDAILNGSDFFKEIKAGSTPIEPGVYIVFYEYHPPSAWSRTEQMAHPGTGIWDGEEWKSMKTAGMTIANYQNERWGINATVRAYMGPLPTLNLQALLEYTPGFPINQTFYISTPEKAAKGKVSSGPHAEYIHAALTAGFEGEFIFKKDSENSALIPVAGYDHKHAAAIKWRVLSKDAAEKLSKEMKDAN